MRGKEGLRELGGRREGRKEGRREGERGGGRTRERQ